MVGAHSLEEMVGKLKRPRRVMILVKAGAAVDAFIDKLVPLLEKVGSMIHISLSLLRLPNKSQDSSKCLVF